jgi:ribulose-5-phosphate 4-epimerase/fuculose-1-phosphate aldolase
MDIKKIKAHSVELMKYISQFISLNQGSGGNFSFKYNNFIYVKSSGKSFKNASVNNFFSKLPLKKYQNRYLKDQFKTQIRSINKLKPSIESPFHIYLDRKYILHVHSINAIFFSDLVRVKNIHMKSRWFFLDYIEPGIQIVKQLKFYNFDAKKYDVIFLKNHGVIFLSNSINNLYKLIRETEKFISQVNCHHSSYLEKNSFISDYFVDGENFKIIIKNSSNKIIFDNSHKKYFFENFISPDYALILYNNVKFIDDINFISKNKLMKLTNNYDFIIVRNLGIIFHPGISFLKYEVLVSLVLLLSLYNNFNLNISTLPLNSVKNLFNRKDEKYRLSLV